MHPTITQLSELAARHKLVPFLGAGCSAGHLGHAWDSIVQEMAMALNTTVTDHLQIAEEYVQKYGQVGLVAFLRDRLTVAEYSDAKGTSHLAMLGLNIGLIYTTNQDNVFEKCCEKYGHQWRRVVRLEVFAEYRPGESLYIKYHGDFDVPESVVFAKSHYDARTANRDHFLNIRLKADLLAKQLLFLGYSLRDDTVKGVLGEVASLFGGRLPHSYLVAYRWSAELEAACASFGIDVVNPMTFYPDASSPGEALDRFISDLCKETMRLKQDEEIGTILGGTTPVSQRVVSRFDIDALTSALPKLHVADGCGRFRAILDLAVIPVEFQPNVVELLAGLCKRCSTLQESEALDSALFNLLLSDRKLIVEAAASVMATANVRPTPKGFVRFNVIFSGRGEMPEMASVVTAARAAELLAEWNHGVTEAFQAYVSKWFDSSPIDFDSLSDELREYVQNWMDFTWQKPTAYEHPVNRYRRLKALPYRTAFKAPGFSEIQRGFIDALPKRFRKPSEE